MQIKSESAPYFCSRASTGTCGLLHVHRWNDELWLVWALYILLRPGGGTRPWHLCRVGYPPPGEIVYMYLSVLVGSQILKWPQLGIHCSDLSQKQSQLRFSGAWGSVRTVRFNSQYFWSYCADRQTNKLLASGLPVENPTIPLRGW